jgi:anaerobic selenocysteine-containing dehydrogenase
MVEVRSRRGQVCGRCRVADIKQGTVFMPFHYGYWDGEERPRAANEITIAEWDPVSKQPFFKYAAVSVKAMED